MTAPFLVVTESMMNTCFFGQWRGGSIHRTGNHMALQGCIQEPCSRLLFQITPFSLLWFFRNRPYVLHNRNKFPRIAAAICLSTPGIVWFILVCVRKWHKPISFYETEIIIFLNINQEMDSVHITWGGHSQPLSSACQWMDFLAHSLLHSESSPCPIGRLISLPSADEPLSFQGWGLL